jgi:hypothetical protein
MRMRLLHANARLARTTRVVQWLVLAVALSMVLPWAGAAHASGNNGRSPRHARVRSAVKPHAVIRPLVFGIYPGGAAGAVGAAAPPLPENPAARLSALRLLRPAGRPFVLHLYVGYGGNTGPSAAEQIAGQLSSYAAAGFEVELVLCYRPADLTAAVDVPGFVAFTRQAIDQLGSNPALVSLQVTNEANVGGAPNASDGYYPGAEDALIQGVIAAKDESRRDGFNQLKIGFNWAYALGQHEHDFWSYLGEHGGQPFLSSLDWVGIDAYPGTWGPALATGLSVDSAVHAATDRALTTLRDTYMPLADVPGTVPIHFSESGYPTGPGRSYATQAGVLEAAVRAVYSLRSEFNVSDYRWFDLRDADSSASSFEDQYGLMTDAYAPKPAFADYQRLVAALSAR